MSDSDENSEFSLKEICCTCLSRNRTLIQLCKVRDGVNDLYLLLSSDAQAYEQGFYRDSASVSQCWECRALMSRFAKFRSQACAVQEQLTGLLDGRIDPNSLHHLSNLTTNHKSTYDRTFVSISSDEDDNIDNFVDCNIEAVTVKAEDDDDDVPLSELQGYDCDHSFTNEHTDYKNKIELTGDSSEHTSINTTNIQIKNKNSIKKIKKTKKLKKEKSSKKTVSSSKSSEHFKINVMNEEVMLDSREGRKMAVSYCDAKFKCESCLEAFKEQIDLENHNSILHTEKPKHRQCEICLCYISNSNYKEHRKTHYMQYICLLCEYVSYTMNDVVKHLKIGHSIKNMKATVKWKKGLRKTPKVMNPGSKPRMNPVMKDKRTPFGYQCTDCDKYFDTKRQRWMHVMRAHKDGFSCKACGKRFAFKYNLVKHERLHDDPPPRQECPTCHKMIRIDLFKTHSLTHSDRERRHCAACNKNFASHASYYHHLKYTRAHADIDNILRYKCSVCEKGYRSKAELRDHENYQHRGRTQHKCPICEKALATVRCVRRHVRRAHQGIKENKRDKICQQCGKGFRDKKSLTEHERRHSGARPLRCAECGHSFRQHAALYTHRRRLHRVTGTRARPVLVES